MAMDQALSKQESGIGAQLSAIRSRFGNRKQLWLIGGIAAALAVIAVMLLWTQSPSYRVLYSGLSEKEAGQVMEALQKSAIPYRIDGTSGALQVPAAQVHEPSSSGDNFNASNRPRGIASLRREM